LEWFAQTIVRQVIGDTASSVWSWAARLFASRRFKQIFGPGVRERVYSLTYAELVLADLPSSDPQPRIHGLRAPITDYQLGRAGRGAAVKVITGKVLTGNFHRAASVESGEGTDMAMTLDRNAQINMTPMIDILLVLIIIFMVITPLTPTGLRTLVPQPAPASREQSPPSRDIVITVRPDGTVRLNQEPVKLKELRQRLKLLVRTATDHVVFVRGEKGLEFRAVAEVIDIANGAGLDRVALMTE
jgi:biopolymer transport protein ExbD